MSARRLCLHATNVESYAPEPSHYVHQVPAQVLPVLYPFCGQNALCVILASRLSWDRDDEEALRWQCHPPVAMLVSNDDDVLDGPEAVVQGA